MKLNKVPFCRKTQQHSWGGQERGNKWLHFRRKTVHLLWKATFSTSPNQHTSFWKRQHDWDCSHDGLLSDLFRDRGL